VARLDIQTLNKLKAISARQTEEYKEALSKYHFLAETHRFASTSALKKDLVYSYPGIAAQIFYHFDDKEIGGLLVKNYSEHFDGKLRELAVGVRQVLKKREIENNSLERVLGIKAIPIMNGDANDEVTEGFIENCQKSLESEAYSL